MKWLTNLLFALLLLSGAALGQSFTNVTGQAKDAQGNLYVNCVYSIHFVGQSSQPGPYLFQGSVFQQTYAGVRCDGFGNFAIRLPSNQAIFPQPSGWEFNICDASGHFCNASGSGIITIAGGSQDITAQMSPLLPILPPPGAEVKSVFGRSGQVVAVTGDYNVSQVTGAAPLTSPVFSGLVQVPTAPVGTFSPQAASTAFVMTAIGNAISGGGGGGGGGWNPPAAPGDTLFGNNTLSTSVPSFFIPGGDISFSSGNFSVNQLHFGPNAFSLTNQGIATGNCLQVSGSTIIGGACGTGGPGGGTVTSFSAGNLSPLFTTSVATGTTTPALSFTLSQAPANTMLGNSGSSAAAPSWIPIPTGPGGGLSGTGTVNLIPKWTAATALGNSLLTDDGTTLTYTGSGGIVTPKFSITQGAFYLESVTGALPALPGAGKNALVSGTDGWYVSNNGGAFVGPLGAGGSVSPSGVSSFGTPPRTGPVVPITGDYTVAQVTGAAPLANPTFTGTAVAPAPSGAGAVSPGNNQIATTAFVFANAGGTASGVTSFNGRQGPVTPALNDYNVSLVTGAAPLAGPIFTGAPESTTPPPNDNSKKIATTDWIQQNYGPSSGGAASVPIAHSAQAPICGSNDVATGTVAPALAVNISTGDTVMVSVSSASLHTAALTWTIHDDAAGSSNAYTPLATRTWPTTGSNQITLSILGTAPGAARAATSMTVSASAAGKFGFCIATYVGVAGFGASPYVNSSTTTPALPFTATLNVQDGGYMFAASGVGWNSTATWSPGQKLDGKVTPTPQPAANSICEATSPAAGPVSCGVTWSGTSASSWTIAAVELIPGVSAPPPSNFPKVVAFHKATITVTTTAFNDTAFSTCTATNCPAGYYRIAWDVLSMTSCAGGALNINVNYFDEFDLVNAYHTGMISGSGASIATARNHVFGSRLMTVAKPLNSTTGIGLTTSADSTVTTPSSSSQCSSGTATAQVTLTVERLQ